MMQHGATAGRLIEDHGLVLINPSLLYRRWCKSGEKKDWQIDEPRLVSNEPEHIEARFVVETQIEHDSIERYIPEHGQGLFNTLGFENQMSARLNVSAQ